MFQSSKIRAANLDREKKMMQYHHQLNNLQCLRRQMSEVMEKKREFDLREKKYHKPHFGPEENEHLVMME